MDGDRIPTAEDVERLGQSNLAIATSIHFGRHHGLTWEQTLAVAVRALAEVNRLQQERIKELIEYQPFAFAAPPRGRWGG